MSEIIIYEPADGGHVAVRLEGESLWLTQEQIAELFGRERSVITKHLRNVFREEELEENSVCANFARTAKDGKIYQTQHYNLDAIISVGYRVNSKRGTQFRQWATRVLRDHLTHGFSIDQQRFETNAAELEAALQLVRHTAQSSELANDMGRGLIEIIGRYTQTFLLLQRYDEGLLTEPAGTLGGDLPTTDVLRQTIRQLKNDQIKRGEASHLFGQERGEAFEAILGNLNQSVLGQAAYPSIESKAAHLLYFIIKDHPFSDGNKRIGAFLFIDFLNHNHALLRNGQTVINDIGLAALALLVAESDPKQKETMIRLIENMLARATP